MQTERSKTLDDRLDEIYAMAHFMYLLLEQVENIDIHVNPHAISRFGKMIVYNVMKVIEYLDAKEEC